MRLDSLLDDVEVLHLEGDPTTDIADVTYSSDEARPGSLFCCVPGGRTDGHEHALDAVDRGAVALIVERQLTTPKAEVAQVRVRDARASMAPIAAAFHGHPSQALDVVGVTGTNGKSTTTYLVRAILEADGRRCGVIGSMNSARTTPEAPELQGRLASFVGDGMQAAAIEVSSVGLARHRVDAVRFAAGVFTNLSVDELTIHGTMDDYFAAKARLFEAGRSEVGVVNADDEWGTLLLDRAAIRMVPYSLADASGLDVTPSGSTFTWRNELVSFAVEGAYNVSNALAAATTCVELGVDVAVIARALSDFEPLPGHGEVIDAGQPFRVVVDFAHTAGALTAVLGAARRAASRDGRVIVVFGCGGDRDRARRAPMGEAAARAADVVVVTSDNPRTEDPLAIVDEVAAGARPHNDDVRVVPDRREAVALALHEARPGDVVVIAGKGHETGQIVGTEVLPFDDRDVVGEVLGS